MKNSLTFELNLFFENSNCIFLDNPKGIYTRGNFQKNIGTLRPDFISPTHGAVELGIWFKAPDIERDAATLLIESTKISLHEDHNSGVIKIRSRIISLIENVNPFSASDSGKILYNNQESSISIGCRLIDAKSNPIYTIHDLVEETNEHANLQTNGAVESTVNALTRLLKTDSCRFTLHVDAVDSKPPIEAIPFIK